MPSYSCGKAAIPVFFILTCMVHITLIKAGMDRTMKYSLISAPIWSNCWKHGRRFAYGMQRDYFDHPNCIGWTRAGSDDQEGSACAVLLSNSEDGLKSMEVGQQHSGQNICRLSWEAILQKLQSMRQGGENFMFRQGLLLYGCKNHPEKPFRFLSYSITHGLTLSIAGWRVPTARRCKQTSCGPS